MSRSRVPAGDVSRQMTLTVQMKGENAGLMQAKCHFRR